MIGKDNNVKLDIRKTNNDIIIAGLKEDVKAARDMIKYFLNTQAGMQ